MTSYCCFLDPSNDYSKKKLDDICPICGQKYGFPLYNVPDKIKDFVNIKPLNRGFYSATFLAERGSLKKKWVLKISPKRLYDFFSKDFRKECEEHLKVAEDSEHIVDIDDYFEEKINFGSHEIECYIAVLEYVEGESLGDVLKKNESVSAKTVAQIAIDLCRFLGELEAKQVSHNDLHSNNILIHKTKKNSRRAEALDNSIRVIIIDFGSLSDESKSSDATDRIGDIHYIAKYLIDLSNNLIDNHDSTSDLDYRLASLLRERAFFLSPPRTSQRTQFDKFIDDIKSAFNQTLSPWSEKLKLRRFNDAYNAQTLEPWFVPFLLEDPDNQWLNKISIRGPQIIMGMRGCGKTMMLRALQFHARAMPQKKIEESHKDILLERLKGEGYTGLYVSSTRLLDTIGKKADEIHEPYARLYVAYSLEALRAVRHLKEIKQNVVESNFFMNIGKAISNFVKSSKKIEEVGSDFELERILVDILVSLSRGENKYGIKGSPSIAFPNLAESINKCSKIWSNHYVLFLLDDVSTRYLESKNIPMLLSNLLFQSEKCAFKITSEAQTIEMVLKSPGNIEKAREGRDYDVFDLGNDVNQKMKKGRGSKKKFVEGILEKRVKYFPNHPEHYLPSQLLGDISLKSIADNIVKAKTADEKRKIYHGISALAGVCVGDIGDVINLYELILNNRKDNKVPIPAKDQSQCYQDLCSRRLYDLNRRKGDLKNFAKSFSEVSYKLLMKSANTDRRRQYLSIHVKLTTDNTKNENQFEKLRELIDAGVFIFAGGSITPRTRTVGADPIQQFKLIYRKLYGLSHYIGLSEKDRFELSNEQLEQWLNYPSKGQEILMQNLGSFDEGQDSDDYDEEIAEYDEEEEDEENREPEQPYLFSGIEEIQKKPVDENNQSIFQMLEDKIPVVTQIDINTLQKCKFNSVILGLGFEDRAPASAKIMMKNTKFDSVTLIRYKEPGKSQEITELVKSYTNNINLLSYEDVRKKFKIYGENILCDVSALVKPAIFNIVRETLKKNKKIYICHTQAQDYYPLNKDIQDVLIAEKKQDTDALLSSLSRILKGEDGPYSYINLIQSDADVSRRRILIASSSPKHERLFSLLDERDYDRIEIFIPERDTPRKKLAEIAAGIAERNFNNTTLTKYDPNDLKGMLDFLIKRYHYWYVERNFNFEIAMTGSKRHAIACAVLSAAFKVSQCWYVQPAKLDLTRFTNGVGQTDIFKIELK